MGKNKEIYVKCDCGSEVIHMEYDHWDEKSSLGQYDVCVYSVYDTLCSKLPWMYRLSWCWRILRTGKVYGDQMVISREKAREIATWIDETEKYANEGETNE